MNVKDLAAWLECRWEGDGSLEIQGVAALEDAGPSDLSFAAGKRGLKQAANSAAGCLIVPEDFPNPAKRTIIFAKDPRAAAARAIERLHPAPRPAQGVHPTAVLGAAVVLGDGVSIGAGCVIGDGVEIGARSILYPRVTLYPGVRIGKEVILHSGCVIGADGFGFVFANGRYEKFPQTGRVEIGDHVEIGANCCIDRAALGVTSIGEGTKLDNLVHVAHNCKIGRHVVIAAQTGLAGGVVIEDYAVIGGQVGIGDHARVESRAVIGSGAGVLTSKVIRAGEPVWGTPARPLRQHLEQLAVLSRLARKRKGE